MPRPPADPTDNTVDAEVCARAGSTIARRFSAAELPRLREAGGHDGSSIEANFQFSEFDARPAVSGQLSGVAMLTCQRCMQPVAADIDDEFAVLIVDAERSDEPGGYEPIVANATRLDLRWLAEEQTLLALPLVPMHEPGECAEQVGSIEVESVSGASADESDAAHESEVRQQPFKNLKDLLRKS